MESWRLQQKHTRGNRAFDGVACEHYRSYVRSYELSAKTEKKSRAFDGVPCEHLRSYERSYGTIDQKIK